MKKKTLLPMLIILLIISVFGFIAEFVRLKNASRRYFDYETRVETQLLARLAERFLRQNDLAGFERFCLDSSRYTVRGASESDLAPPDFRTKPSDAQRPFELISRVTLFDANGDVLFDSWENAATMENHRDRPELLEILRQSNAEPFPFCVFERYSTTVEKTMLYCATRFEVDSARYILRLGNTHQAIQAADGIYRRDLARILFFALAIVLLLLISYASQMNAYRRKISALDRECSDPSSENTFSSQSDFQMSSVDRMLHSIEGNFRSRTTRLHREKRLRDTIFQSLLEGVILLDSENRILDINENACRLLGILTQKAQGQSLTALWRSHEFETLLRQSAESPSNETVRGELSLDLAGGTRQLDVRLRVISREEPENVRLLLLYDLTFLRRLENFRKEFVSNVSHELKTPLTVIMGTVEALRDGALADEQQARAFLATLATHTTRLYALVQDVLTLAHLETDIPARQSSYTPQSLAEAAASAMALCEPLCATRRIELRFCDLCDHASCLMDAGLMEQAILNLIDNAVKYSCDFAASSAPPVIDHPKKTVVIRLSNPDRQSIALEVIDEGPGISEADQTRIFERFYRVDPSRSRQTGGTGLGLAIVKHIVQLHGGSVAVKNNPHQGCTFTILLPICSDTPCK